MAGRDGEQLLRSRGCCCCRCSRLLLLLLLQHLLSCLRSRGLNLFFLSNLLLVFNLLHSHGRLLLLWRRRTHSSYRQGQLANVHGSLILWRLVMLARRSSGGGQILEAHFDLLIRIHRRLASHRRGGCAHRHSGLASWWRSIVIVFEIHFELIDVMLLRRRGLPHCCSCALLCL